MKGVNQKNEVDKRMNQSLYTSLELVRKDL